MIDSPKKRFLFNKKLSTVYIHILHKQYLFGDWKSLVFQCFINSNKEIWAASQRREVEIQVLINHSNDKKKEREREWEGKSLLHFHFAVESRIKSHSKIIVCIITSKKENVEKFSKIKTKKTKLIIHIGQLLFL